MDVKNGSEGGGKLICKVGCIGSWLCVERGSKNVTFEVVNINSIVGAVLDGCSFGCRVPRGKQATEDILTQLTHSTL
jgi:hypothetical protein